MSQDASMIKTNAAPALFKPLSASMSYLFLFIWMRVLFTSPVLASYAPTAVTPVKAQLGAMLTITLSSFALAFLVRFIYPSLSKKWIGFCLGLLGALGTSAIILANAEIVDSSFALVGYCAVSLPFVWIFLSWQDTLASYGIRNTVLVLSILTILGMALFPLLLLLPTLFTVSISVCLPLLAVLTLSYGTQSAQRIGYVLPQPRSGNSIWIRKAPHRLLALVLLTSLTLGALRTSGVFQNLTFDHTNDWLTFGMCTTVAILFGSLVAFHSHRKNSIGLAFSLALSTLAIGTIALAQLPLDFATASLLLVNFGAELVRLLVLILVIDEVFTKRLPALGILALLLGAQYGGLFAGQLIGSNEVIAFSTVSYTVLFVIVLAALILAGMKGKLELSHQAFIGQRDSLESRIEELSGTVGLTNREHEVLSIWATGHNSAHIENTLHITNNTVKTHLKHIYEKTGTTNREELLELLDRIKPTS